MSTEANYVCTSCREELVLPINVPEGREHKEQEYVEPCPICTHPNLIHIETENTQVKRVWVDED